MRRLPAEALMLSIEGGPLSVQRGRALPAQCQFICQRTLLGDQPALPATLGPQALVQGRQPPLLFRQDPIRGGDGLCIPRLLGQRRVLLGPRRCHR